MVPASAIDSADGSELGASAGNNSKLPCRLTTPECVFDVCNGRDGHGGAGVYAGYTEETDGCQQCDIKQTPVRTNTPEHNLTWVGGASLLERGMVNSVGAKVGHLGAVPPPRGD